MSAPLLLRFAEGPWRWLGPAGVFVHAFVMGGAIPALAAAAGGETQRSVGRLYASSAAGASLGLPGGRLPRHASGSASTTAAAARR